MVSRKQYLKRARDAGFHLTQGASFGAGTMVSGEKTLPKICVILGAGASYDVRNEGSDFLNPGLRPPLARELFNLEERSDFRSIIRHYAGAVVIAQDLAPKSKASNFDLEKELRRIAEHTSGLRRDHYKHIPPYLRDLLTECSYGYTPYPSCYVRLVQDLLAEAPSDVLFLVLNYDDLLEQALYQFTGGTYRFESLDDYVRAERSVKLVKLHGSINWFKSIGPLSTDWETLVRESDVLAKPPVSEIHVASTRGTSDRSRTFDMQIAGQRVYPVLTAPLAGKGAIDAVCPAGHLATAREFLSDCNRFLIIGASMLDNDLLDLLNGSINVAAGWVQIVSGNEAQGKKVWERFRSGGGLFGKVFSPGAQVAFAGGFQRYGESGGLIEFLRVPIGRS